MPVYDKIEGYTLRGPFVAGGGIYTSDDVEKLILWTRFYASPIDDSTTSMTVAYDGTPQIDNKLIPDSISNRVGYFSTATFSDVNNDNAVVAGNPALVFRNSSGDTPFSFSTWVYINDWSGSPLSARIFQLANVANSFATLSCSVDALGRLSFGLRDASAVQIYATSEQYSVPLGKWCHIAGTYNGNEIGGGISIYVNGKECENVNRSLSTAYAENDTNSGRNLFIGANWAGIYEMDGALAEFCMWKKELSKSAVKAIYSSTSGRYKARSGIVSLPNRVRLRETDSLTGSYPPSLRTTGFSGSLKGNGKSTFNDTTTQIFNNSPDAIFPLVQNQGNLDHAILDNLIASPNHNSNLTSIGAASAYLSTEGFRKHVDYGMQSEPFDETRIFLMDKNVSFYASGTSGSIYPGLGSPLRDKIAINIPMANSSQKLITRYSNMGLRTDTEGLFPDYTFASTGFYYYNFNLGTWECKGLNKSKTRMYYRTVNTAGQNAVTLGTTFPYGPKNSLSPAPSNTDPYSKMQQFKMSDHMGVMIDSKADSKNLNHGATASHDPYSTLTSSLGYDKIGAPTIAGQAPWHYRYHATGSQTLRMSDYIANDFLLEKAVIDIPVIVQRMRGEPSNPSGISRYFDSCRDIDNYTFFLYKQRKSPSSIKDSKFDVTGSQRVLIASGCASFYNSNAFSGRVPAAILSRGLPHGPSFSHDFNAPTVYNSIANAHPLITAFTGTIRVEMQVAIPNAQPIGATRWPMLAADAWGTRSVGDGYISVITQDYWPGGTNTYSGSLELNSSRNVNVINPSNFTHSENNSYAAGLGPFAVTSSGQPRKLGSDWRSISQDSLLPYKGPTSYINPYHKIDTSLNEAKVGDENSIGILGYTYKSTSYLAYPILFGGMAASEVSPFLLSEEDELIIGIDAGISMLPASGSGQTSLISKLVNAGEDLGFYRARDTDKENFGCMSGSFMKIQKGKASLTLFGSEVKMQKEQLLNTNQNLTTDAIHEVICDNRVLDQFENYSRLSMSSSYLDRYIGGQVQQMTNAQIALLDVETQNYAGSGFKYGGTIIPGRRVLALFSKNTAGTVGPDLSPFVNQSIGYPPRVALGMYESNEYIIKDHYNLSPYSANIFQASDRNSLQRFNVIPDSNEIYYDSMAPDLLNLAARSKPTFQASASYHSGGKIFVTQHASISSTKDWVYRTNPNRYTNQQYILRQFPSQATVTAGDTFFYQFENEDSTRLRNMTLFNDGFNYDNYEAKGGATVRHFRSPITGAFGPMYGMISPTVIKSTARYRMSSYGQYRDMLEQRHDTKYYISLSAYNNGLVPGLGDSPVQVTFVNSENGTTKVDPYSTDSSNFSYEYTSSMPYSDGESILPESRRLLFYYMTTPATTEFASPDYIVVPSMAT